MLSKTNYITITLIMLGVLMMFQLTGVSENVIMAPGENLYATQALTREEMNQDRKSYEELKSQLILAPGEGAEVGLVGSLTRDCLEVARQWCVDQKRSYCYYESLEQAAADQDGAGFLVLDGASLSGEDGPVLEQLVEQGRNVVVSGLPDTRVLNQEKGLRNMLGIDRVRHDEITVEGIKIFQGLILGGETVYKDFSCTMPDFQLLDSVTAYVVAYSDQDWIQELDNEELPAAIWRYAPDAGKVYVVNGDFLEGQMGAGLLTGFAADSERIYLYPVVNAQVSVVENYPMVTKENQEFMEQTYGQDAITTLRDILWPSIVAIFEDTGDTMTATASLRYDYQEKGEMDSSLVEYYYEQITKEEGEIGLSGAQISQVPLEEKLAHDLAVYREELPNYSIRTFQAGALEPEEYLNLLGEGNLLEEITTVLTDYREEASSPFFRYLKGNALSLPIYMEGTTMEASDDLRARCLQTAYGYYGTSVDIMRVVYPQEEDDLWNVMSNRWAENYRPYRVPFEAFEKVTALEADNRVRNYLALDFELTVTGDEGVLTLDGGTEGYFIARVHGESLEVLSGGTAQEIEEGWYLIQAEGQSLKFRLEQKDKAKYYIQ